MSEVIDQARRNIRRWRAEPWSFVREVLRVDELDWWQDEGLHAAAAGTLGIPNEVNPEAKNRLAFKASKGPGKSAELSFIGWWFITCFWHPKAVATSISGDNLRDGLWTELALWQQRSPLLKAMFQWNAERIFAKDHPETWWLSARQWSKSANAEQQANTLAGLHAENVLILVDESGGIPDGVVAAADAGLANADPRQGKHALMVQAGNPTHLEGPLYRACTRERKLWWVKEISGDPDDPKRAKRVSVKWAREQIEKYGRDHPYVLVNVFGRFPPGQSNALIAADDASAAAARELGLAEYKDEVKVLGVDVARFGDDRSVIFLRQGRVAFRPKVFRNVDTMGVADQVALVIQEQVPDATFIDQTGIGAGVVDRLLQLGYPVIGVDNAGKAAAAKFANRRAEMWWAMADWVRAGGCIPEDAELIGELVAPTYKFDASGRLVLESKADLKKRGLPSPDKADALALTFSAPVAQRGLRAKMGLQGPRVVHDWDPFEHQKPLTHDWDPFKAR